MKELADDNFKFNENGRKLPKWVENTVGKGEIARYEQFLLFPQCFQKACFPGVSKGVIVWEWVKMSKIQTMHFVIFCPQPLCHTMIPFVVGTHIHCPIKGITVCI